MAAIKGSPQQRQERMCNSLGGWQKLLTLHGVTARAQLFLGSAVSAALTYALKREHLRRRH